MSKYIFTVVCFLFFSFLSKGQYQRLPAFIPAAYSILDSASGDINKDGKKDLVLILKSKEEEMKVDTSRPLLLLAGDGKGSYKLEERNDSIVLCRGCGGAFGDPYAGITIKNGFFSIEHYGGSSWRWTRIITFRYDSKLKQYILHRDAGDSFHTSDPDKSKLHIYNKEDFGKLLFRKYTYSKSW